MQGRNSILDFWKFVAAMLIALMHYNWEIVPHGYLGVELFFLLTGYMIYSNRDKYRKKYFSLIILSKIKSIYFYWIILLALGLIYRLYVGDIIWSLGTWVVRIIKMLFFIPFLFETTISSPDSFWLPWGQLWYIPIWFVVSSLAIMVVRVQNAGRVKCYIFVASIIITEIVYNSHSNHMLNITTESAIGPFPFALVRGLQDVTLGLALGVVSEEVKNWKNKVHINYICKIFATLLEIGCILCLGTIYFMRSVTPEVDYIYIIFASVLIMLCELDIDFINSMLKKVFEGKIVKLFRLSTAIYFFHYPIIIILRMKYTGSMSARDVILYLFLVVIVSWIGTKIECLFRKTCKSLWHKMYY